MNLPRSIFHVCAYAAIAVGLTGQEAFTQIFQPPPSGSVYREYTYRMHPNNQWRVTDPDAANYFQAAADELPNPEIDLPGVDLSNATSAEVVISVWGGHTGTNPKLFRLNYNDWITVPEIETTPSSGQCYMSQYNVTVDVPLSDLSGGTNVLEGNAGDQDCYSFNWGQWGWYAIIIRVYYDPSSVDNPTGSITSPGSGGTVNENPTITATASGGGGIAQVDFLGYYYGFDTDGDGVFTEWHRDYHVEEGDGTVNVMNHVGTAYGSPYNVTWYTDQVPDQPGAVKFIARIKGNNGLWYVTDEVTGVTFARTSGSLVLYTPSNVPENYWVREDKQYKENNVEISNGSGITGGLLHARTWNGINGSMESGESKHLQVNGSWTAPEHGANHYYKYDVIGISGASSVLYAGTNTVEFFTNTVHHGIEILWPGAAISVAYSAPVPIQLASFFATALSEGGVRLDWRTISETNNYGFEIQKSLDNSDSFQTIPNSFVPGHGTTIEPQEYSFEDPEPLTGVVYYRLKQIDLDNSVHFSDAVRVDYVTGVAGNGVPFEYFLSQNHPNPFNPSTMIRYGIPDAGMVILEVYDIIGQRVRALVEERQEAGTYEIRLDANGLPSGTYFYRLQSGTFVETKKLTLVR
ncbi:MAG: Ig-like domain-containing protein [Bacteroidota bacterium]